MTDLMLTTKDNPYDPREDYDKWKMWDEEHEYFTESFIGRMLLMEDDYDVDDEVSFLRLRDKVLIDILENDITDMYVLV